MNFPTGTERDAIIASIVAMLQDDVASGAIPANVADWDGLRGHVDPNEYTIQAVGDDWESTDEWYDWAREVENDAFAAFSAARGPRNDVTVNMCVVALVKLVTEKYLGVNPTGGAVLEVEPDQATALAFIHDNDLIFDITAGCGLTATDFVARPDLAGRVEAEAARRIAQFQADGFYEVPIEDVLPGEELDQGVFVARGEPTGKQGPGTWNIRLQSGAYTESRGARVRVWSGR
jgi:hypothetical protein